MVNYPNGKKATGVKIKSTANRGMTLENDLNITNSHYNENKMAVVYKKPTPVQIVKVDYPSRNKAKIVEAYYKTPSTTDYCGVYRGYSLDFEAKETKSKTSFSLSNIHHHQIEHLKNVIHQSGIAFFIIRFVSLDMTYFVFACDIIKMYDNGSKSIPYKWFEENAVLIPFSLLKPIDYLNVINQTFKTKE